MGLQPVAFTKRKGKDHVSDDDYYYFGVGKGVGDPAPETPVERRPKMRSTGTSTQAKEAQKDLRSDDLPPRN